MQTRAADELRAARAQGLPEFTTTATRVAGTGLVIPPIRRSGERRWRLEQDWTVDTPWGGVTVPHGRDTDLADVPALLRPWINDFQFGITGPLLHDFIYEHAGVLPASACPARHRFTRSQTDRLFYSLMRDERVPLWRRLLAYGSVRLGGASHWRMAVG